MDGSLLLRLYIALCSPLSALFGTGNPCHYNSHSDLLVPIFYRLHPVFYPLFCFARWPVDFISARMCTCQYPTNTMWRRLQLHRTSFRWAIPSQYYSFPKIPAPKVSEHSTQCVRTIPIYFARTVRQPVTYDPKTWCITRHFQEHTEFSANWERIDPYHVPDVDSDAQFALGSPRAKMLLYNPGINRSSEPLIPISLCTIFHSICSYSIPPLLKITVIRNIASDLYGIAYPM